MSDTPDPSVAGAFGALPRYPGSDRTVCEVCGCAPANFATFRGHRGLLVLMQFRQISGVFCRDCALETFRDMTAATLLQGWWGFLSFFITPAVVLVNLASRGDVASLSAP